MAELLATRADVEAVLLRPLTDTERLFVDRLIDKASARLRQATKRSVDHRLELHALDPANPLALDPVVVADVVGTVVARFIANPDGATTRSQTAGVYAESVTYATRGGDKAEVRGQLVVTESDLAALAAPVPAQVGTITLAGSPTMAVAMQQTSRRAPGQVFR